MVWPSPSAQDPNARMIELIRTGTRAQKKNEWFKRCALVTERVPGQSFKLWRMTGCEYSLSGCRSLVACAVLGEGVRGRRGILFVLARSTEFVEWIRVPVLYDVERSPGSTRVTLDSEQTQNDHSRAAEVLTSLRCRIVN